MAAAQRRGKGTARRRRKSPDDTTETAADKRLRAAWLRVLVARQAGKKPSVRDESAYKQYEADTEERRRWEYYRRIPQRHWRKMAGDRQTSTINRQAETYGIPFGGAWINLADVVLALHRFLAKHARLLASARRQGEDDDVLLLGPQSPALEKYRTERARLVELERMERERTVIRREVVRDGLIRIVQVLSDAAAALRREFGNDAADLLEDAIADAKREIEARFPEDVDGFVR